LTGSRAEPQRADGACGVGVVRRQIRLARALAMMRCRQSHFKIKWGALPIGALPRAFFARAPSALGPDSSQMTPGGNMATLDDAFRDALLSPGPDGPHSRSCLNRRSSYSLPAANRRLQWRLPGQPTRNPAPTPLLGIRRLLPPPAHPLLKRHVSRITARSPATLYGLDCRRSVLRAFRFTKTISRPISVPYL